MIQVEFAAAIIGRKLWGFGDTKNLLGGCMKHAHRVGFLILCERGCVWVKGVALRQIVGFEDE